MSWFDIFFTNGEHYNKRVTFHLTVIINGASSSFDTLFENEWLKYIRNYDIICNVIIGLYILHQSKYKYIYIIYHYTRYYIFLLNYFYTNTPSSIYWEFNCHSLLGHINFWITVFNLLLLFC